MEPDFQCSVSEPVCRTLPYGLLLLRQVRGHHIRHCRVSMIFKFSHRGTSCFCLGKGSGRWIRKGFCRIGNRICRIVYCGIFCKQPVGIDLEHIGQKVKNVGARNRFSADILADMAFPSFTPRRWAARIKSTCLNCFACMASFRRSEKVSFVIENLLKIECKIKKVQNCAYCSMSGKRVQ